MLADSEYLPKRLAKTIIPWRYHNLFRRVLKQIHHYGFSHYCPICRSHLQSFLAFGSPLRQNACCPVCGSLERHRLIYLFLSSKTTLFHSPKKKMLHVAPEQCLVAIFQASSNIDYVSVDLAPGAMHIMDLTDLQFPDNTFDAVYASHVLEHIVNDRKAVREIFRVLKPLGWAILQVPITGDKTYEDADIVTPEDRERVFGQHDHVRTYGEDYYDRLRQAGLVVIRHNVPAQQHALSAKRLGISQTEDIVFCIKPGP